MKRGGAGREGEKEQPPVRPTSAVQRLTCRFRRAAASWAREGLAAMSSTPCTSPPSTAPTLRAGCATATRRRAGHRRAPPGWGTTRRPPLAACRCRRATPSPPRPAGWRTAAGARAGSRPCAGARLWCWSGGGGRSHVNAGWAVRLMVAARMKGTACFALQAAAQAAPSAPPDDGAPPPLTHRGALHHVDHHHPVQPPYLPGGGRPHGQGAPHAVADDQGGHPLRAAAEERRPDGYHVPSHGLHARGWVSHAWVGAIVGWRNGEGEWGQPAEPPPPPPPPPKVQVVFGGAAAVATQVWSYDTIPVMMCCGYKKDEYPVGATTGALLYRSIKAAQRKAATRQLPPHLSLSCCATSDHVKPV